MRNRALMFFYSGLKCSVGLAIIHKVAIVATDLSVYFIHMYVHLYVQPYRRTVVGLNFAPAPKEIPIPKIVASIESGIRDLPESNKESVRATVTNILKYSKPPTCNLSRQQKLALKSLRRDNSIIIIPADKGKATAVMDSDEYTNKINELLSGKETYLKITDRRRNPVSKVEKDLTISY